MGYRYYLPNSTNDAIECETENNAIIIIGSNGSGKSKLGAWMEQQDNDTTYRIGAQRSLVFGQYIQQRSYEQATNILLYGNEHNQGNHNQRWNYDGEKYNYTSSMLNDYEAVLSAIVALQNKEQEEYLNECKMREKQGIAHKTIPIMAVDKLQQIWNSVFPQRQISLKDGKVMASLWVNGECTDYKGRDMSDGERVALYLIVQALCVPENKTVIIDEPELHLHRSIMNRLWSAIENVRQDCLFVYITHDTQFAATHLQAKKIWVKSFDGTCWELEEIMGSALPEELLLNILGNRRPVIFVEGTAGSYDSKLYSAIYNDYYIVPCGSCTNVISWTKAMRANNQLHHLNCYGLIDRDYRSEHEISRLKTDDIFVLDVAEVENLFIVRKLLLVINKLLGFADNCKVEQTISYIVQDRFANQKDEQERNAILAELKYKLSTLDLGTKTAETIKENLQNSFNCISYEEIEKSVVEMFAEIDRENNYDSVLKVFNCKSLASSVGHFFDIENKAYCDYVLRQMCGCNRQMMIEAILPYLPADIPIIPSC